MRLARRAGDRGAIARRNAGCARGGEFNTGLAFAKARYRGSVDQLNNFGIDRPIGVAPAFIGSVGVLVDHLRPWFVALQWRNLGSYPVSDGDKFPRDKG